MLKGLNIIEVFVKTNKRQNKFKTQLNEKYRYK